MPAKRDFVKDVYSLVGDEYTVLGNYINNKTKILMIHNKCGYQWDVQPAHFLNGSRCPKCGHKIPYTTETFKERVIELVGDEYSVQGEYIDSRKKIIMKHNVCGYSFEIPPNKFIQGGRCPQCSNRIPYTIDSFKAKVEELVGDEYTVTGDWVNTQTKISIRHNICGEELYIRPTTFIQGHRCAKCAGVKKHTTDSFKERVYHLVGEEFLVLGDYINNKNKIRMLHTACGYEFEIKPNHFLSGVRCPKCSGRQQLTTEIFKERVKKQVGEEYTVLGEYVNLKTKIKMRHNVCGCVYDVDPSNFLMGHGCPNCYKTIPYTTETFKNKVYELVGDNYTVLNEYVNSNVKIQMKHNICGHEYDVLPSLFIHGNRCPKCSVNLRRSLPEEIVAYYVSQYFGIIQGYRPDWLKLPSGRNAEIDIWIPELNVGIEYDGGIHGQIENYERDKLKNHLISESKRCNTLYRIREVEAYDMKDDSGKIHIIKMKESINLTSKKSRIELSSAIKKLLEQLGVNASVVEIDKKIITICQNRLDEYRQKI